MRKSVLDHVFDNEPVHGMQQKCDPKNNSNREVTDPINDKPNSARLSDVLNTESTMIGSECGEDFSRNRLEDSYRRRRYGRQISRIRSELLGEQQKLGLKVFSDENKNHALFQLKDIYCQFCHRWKELERLGNYLMKKKQDDERNAIESAQSIMPFEYEHFDCPVQTQASKNLYTAEKVSDLPDECVSKCNYRNHEMKQCNVGQPISKTTRKYRNEFDKRTQFLALLNKFSGIHEKLQSFQTNLNLLNDERQVIKTILTKLNRDIGILENQKQVLETTLIECKEKEEIIQNEILQLSSQMGKLKHELRKCKNSEGVSGVAGQLDAVETAVKNEQIEHADLSDGKSSSISKQYALKMQLLQDIHREELHLYKLQLDQAAQQISVLEAQLEDNARREVIKKERGLKHKTRSRIRRESSLVNDGTVHRVTKLIDTDICEIHSKMNVPELDNESLPNGNHVSINKDGNDIHLESTLKSLVLDQFSAFKQEMLNVIGEEVKQNIIRDDNGFMSLENNMQEVVSGVKLEKQDEAINGDDEQTCVDLLQDSTLHEKRNILDCGRGMAFNFYYGYLKLILPVGTEFSTQGIKRRIHNYIKDQRLSDNAFPMKKLIILIPQNTYTPSSLTELSIDDPSDGNKYWIESVKPLEPEVIVRNGWKREFPHSVYRIKDPNSESRSGDYVVAEFATPVKVFDDIILKCPVPKISEAFKVYKQKIISSFHNSLLERMRKNDDGCRDLCEIIYYPDTDKNGKRVNIGRIILDRIHSKSKSCFQ